jgi:hypothetical protein
MTVKDEIIASQQQYIRTLEATLAEQIKMTGVFQEIAANQTKVIQGMVLGAIGIRA